MKVEKLTGYHMGNSIEEATESIHTYMRVNGFVIGTLKIEVEYNFNKNRYDWEVEVITP